MLSTPWSRSFGLRVPIVNAPMGGVAGGRLAAAVTAAGGLGMVGMGSDGTRELLKTQLRHVGGAFGIGLVDWVTRTQAGLLEEALAARPALLSVSFGTDWSWVTNAHNAGIPTVTQVYDDVGARQAVDAGVDILVARGSEGAGHGEVKLGTLPLLDTVLDAVTVPVLAGGGIASPRRLAAARAGQRLRREMDRQRGRARCDGLRRTGRRDGRRRSPDRPRRRRPGRRDDRRRRIGGRGHRADVYGRGKVAGRLGFIARR
jgi:nitronate monooxygenase